MSGEVLPEGAGAEKPAVRSRQRAVLWLWAGGALLVAGGVALCLGWQQVRWRTNPQRTRTHQVAQMVQTAVEAYQAEYEHLPRVTSGSGRIDTVTPDGVELLKILMAQEPEASEPKNPNRLRFLVLAEGKDNKGGLSYGDGKQGLEGLYDPWGGSYQILLDTNGDGLIDGPKGSPRIQGGVGVYSPGPDREAGTWDDVRSW